MSAFLRTLWEAFGLFGIVGRERLRFLLYTCVNILLGALGILAPIAAGIWAASEPPMTALAHVLKDGNGYTFAVALLATSSAFLLNDIVDRERRPSEYVGVRMVAGLLGVVLLITLTLYSGMHFFAKVIEAIPAPIGQGAPAVGPVTMPSVRWTGQEKWQAALLLITVFYAIWLFCLQHVDAHEDYAQTFRDKRSELITSAQGASTASGIQA